MDTNSFYKRIGIGSTIAALGGAAALMLGPSGGVSPRVGEDVKKQGKVVSDGTLSENGRWLLQDIDIGQGCYLVSDVKKEALLLVIVKNDESRPERVGVFNFKTNVFEWHGINEKVGNHRFDIGEVHVKVCNW